MPLVTEIDATHPACAFLASASEAAVVLCSTDDGQWVSIVDNCEAVTAALQNTKLCRDAP